MTDNRQNSAAGRRRAGLWAYNVRILVGNTYWLIATPIAATQLVLFWNMATATLFSPTRAAQTIELLAPILGAFLCAHALAPEQDGVGELVFVRPISIEKVLLLRLAVIFAFVLVVLIPAFVIYQVGIDDFPLALTVAAAAPSVLFLSLLAMALASATRHPLIGFGGAGIFWVLDVAVGSYFNPLVCLHGFAGNLAGRPMAEQWMIGKLVLLVLAVLLYLWNRSLLGRPAAPRRWVGVVRRGLLICLLLLSYVATGAAYKVAYGIRHERDSGYRTRLWYQQQFRGYGPLPVAWMFGPAFPLYVQAELGRGLPVGGTGSGSLWTRLDATRMELLLERYPDSIWADNAQFELATYWRRRRAVQTWEVVSYRAGAGRPVRTRMAENVERGADEFQRLVDRYPDSPFAPLALSERAHIGLSLLDFGMAIAAYERLVTEYSRVPEAYRAGTALSAMYSREQRYEEALRAADVAAEAAPWHLRAEPLLAAAQSAMQLGSKELSLRLYERARAAAVDAVERAIRGERNPTRMAKGELFERSNMVIRACESALSGRATHLAPIRAGAEVLGRVMRDGQGVPGVRIAIGASSNAQGLPTPFSDGAVMSATTARDGGFRLSSVPPGRYPLAAFALRVPEDEQDLAVDGLSLPILVESVPVMLPDLNLRVAGPEEEESTSAAGPSWGEARRSRGEVRGSRGEVRGSRGEARMSRGMGGRSRSAGRGSEREGRRGGGRGGRRR